MIGEAKIIVPVAFIDEAPLRQLAVTEEGLQKLLGLDDGRSKASARKCSWRFRVVHGIRKEPGGVFSVEAIRRALNAEAKSRRTA